MSSALALLTFVCACVCASDDVIITPKLAPGPDVDTIGLIWIQGQGLAAESYKPVALAVQAEAEAIGLRIYIGIVQCAASEPNPRTVASGITRVNDLLLSNGMPADTPMYSAAHSVGTVFLQMFEKQEMHDSYEGAVASTEEDRAMFAVHASKVKFHAAVVMGGFVLHMYEKEWRQPIMHLAGEVDGMCRITRVAQNVELVFNKYGGINNATAVRDYPLVVIEGGSHMQFSSGAPTQLVKERDIKPFVSYDIAHKYIGINMANFLKSQVTGTATTTLVEAVERSYRSYWTPLLKAFEEEGMYTLKPPCNCNNPQKEPFEKDPYFGRWINYYPCLPGTTTPACRANSSWAGKMHRRMNGLPSVNAITTSSYHPVDQTRPNTNLPYVFENCTKPDASCTLHITGVVENTYEKDPLDGGFFFQTAHEIRSKQLSRQRMQLAAGVPASECDFKDTDAITKNRCAELNELAIAYGREHLTIEAGSRYDTIGSKIVTGNDIKTLGGPTWANNALHFDKVNGQMVISSPSLAEKYPFVIKQVAGVHYCKLLSPARALEWMMIDSLRLHHGLN